MKVRFAFIIFTFLLVPAITSNADEGYKARKILLGTFKMGDNGFSKEGLHGLAWDRIHR